MSDLRGYHCDHCGEPATYSTLIGCERFYCCDNPDCGALHDADCREGEEICRENEYWDERERGEW